MACRCHIERKYNCTNRCHVEASPPSNRRTKPLSSFAGRFAPPRFGTATELVMASAGIRFGRVVLMARGAEGVANSVNFYQNALGLTVIRHTDDWAELACPAEDQSGQQTPAAAGLDASAAAPSFRLTIKSVESEAHLSTGYGPILTFDVDDMDMAVARCAQMGGKLDGPIQYPAHGKVAALRAPDGYVIGLYEPSIV